MLYLNQLEYSHIPYQHNMAHGGAPEERRNVGTSGCGLCTLCMIVEHLTGKILPLEECVRLSEENGANHSPGTDLVILGPIVAGLYGLECTVSQNLADVISCLQNGGEVALRAAGDRDGAIGLFSHRAHYVLLTGIEGDEVQFLDPSYRVGKYEEDDRGGRVRDEYPLLYTAVAEVDAAGCTNFPPYYLFRKKA